MRILWITPEIPMPTDNGHRVVYCNRIIGMSDLGHSIYLCAFTENDFEFAYKKSLLEYCEQVNLFKKKKLHRSLNLLWMPHHILKRNCLEFQQKVEYLLISMDIDILMIDSINMAQYLPKYVPSPTLTVLSVHNIDHILLRRSALLQKTFAKRVHQHFESLKTKIYENRVYKTNRFDSYIFLSEKERDFITARYPKIKAIFSPIGVRDNTKNGSRKRPSQKTILFLGNLSYFCNIESITWFVREVYPLILSRTQDVRLNIVGKQPGEAIHALAKQHSSIRIIPDVPDIAPIFLDADIVVAPITSGAGVKVKVLEALSAKKLVVTTEMGIEGTRLEDAKHLLVVKNFDNKTFASRCVQALADQENLQKIADAGYKYVLGCHGWTKIIKALHEDLSMALAIKREGTRSDPGI